MSNMFTIWNGITLTSRLRNDINTRALLRQSLEMAFSLSFLYRSRIILVASTDLIVSSRDIDCEEKVRILCISDN